LEYYTYADQTVEDLFEEKKGTLPCEAALVLNVWMYATHELFDGVEDCARLSDASVNAEAAGLADNGRGAYAFEEMMAFYIGHDQEHGGTDDGGGGGPNGLYALAQIAGSEFGTVDQSTGEAASNANLKKLFLEMQSVTSNSNACRPGSDTVGKLWSLTHRMIAQMCVPLLQMLLKSMKENDVDRVKLYAKAIVPQMSRCRPSTYRSLKENLLDRPYESDMFDSLLADLQSMSDCLGVTCADVGAFRETEIPECAAYPAGYPIAEYGPTTDVHEHAKIDLDVAELEMLLCFGSDRSYQMAKWLYMYGHNSRKTWESDDQFLSLQEMAVSTTKDKSSWSTLYTEYHQDKHFADKVIVDTLSGKGKWGAAPPEQRSEIIAKTVQYQVIFLYLLGEMADAMADCATGDATDNDGAVHSWDEVVAYYVGSLEGTSEGGSDDFSDGRMMWNLGNRRCSQFGTENSDGWSVVMAAVEDLFYAGKGELDAYDCTKLEQTVHKIEHLSLIPLMQSVIRYAIANEKHAWNSPSKDLAEGEAFALAVLPILAKYDPVAQDIVEENMIVTEGREPVIGGAQAVADAFYGVMTTFGLECEFVGASDGVDTCKMSQNGSGSGSVIAADVTILALGTISTILAML